MKSRRDGASDWLLRSSSGADTADSVTECVCLTQSNNGCEQSHYEQKHEPESKSCETN